MVKSKNKNWIFWALIIFVILILLVVFLNLNTLKTDEQKDKEVTLTKDNFIILSYNYMNSGAYAGSFKESSCTLKPTDRLVLNYRLINFPLTKYEIHQTHAYFQIYSDGEKWDISEVYYNAGTGISSLEVTLPLSKSHNVMLCFEAINSMIPEEGSGIVKMYNIKSNEVCLDSINVPALC